MRCVVLTAALLALIVALAGCGGSKSSPNSSAPHSLSESAIDELKSSEHRNTASGTTPVEATPTTEAEAPITAESQVLKTAQILYRSQGVMAARCVKTGFVPSASIYECTLSTQDGETEPSKWRVFESQTGVPENAVPAE